MRTQAEIEERFTHGQPLEQARRFHLAGIGGAGMSALAKMLVHRGHAVAGSDASEGPALNALRDAGVQVRLGHSGEGLQEGDALVLSDAIGLEASPEVQRAAELDVPLYRRSQVLAWLLRDKQCICVAGTHGKTTTTGMIGAGLLAAEVSPTIVVGAEVPAWGGSVVEGEGRWAVIEACEAYDSLRDFNPYIVVLTNLEFDHSDFHASFEALVERFENFVGRIAHGGTLVFNGEDPDARQVADRFPGSKIDFSRMSLPFEPILPGEHNRANARAALAACELVTSDEARVREGIAGFAGAGRRLQELATVHGITIVDDYAHHPTEIAASLQALREKYPGRRLVLAYQPHLYSRTEQLLNQFASTLDGADFVVLTDIYPAREAPIPGISSARIAEQLQRPNRYVPSRRLVARALAREAVTGDVVVTMGAGNIEEVATELPAEIERQLRLASGQLRVAVIFGGVSAEREVSIISGAAVARALEAKGHTVQRIDAGDRLLQGDAAWLRSADRPDAAFLAIHGSLAEDGALQGYLELAGIPYTGSSILASALAFDKLAAKRLFEEHGIPVACGIAVRDLNDPMLASMGMPVVVKPARQGSTVGLSFVRDAASLPLAVARALNYDSVVLVEEMIEGTEISVPVVVDRALLPVEIVSPPEQGYDFAAKYTPGVTQKVCPSGLAIELQERAQTLALRCHVALGCEGATRTDMIVTEGGEIVVLELNTLPGMTPTSLLATSAAAMGVSFEELSELMLQDAVRRHVAP